MKTADAIIGMVVECISDAGRGKNLVIPHKLKIGERYVVSGVIPDRGQLQIEGHPVDNGRRGWGGFRFKFVDLEKEGPRKG